MENLENYSEENIEEMRQIVDILSDHLVQEFHSELFALKNRLDPLDPEKFKAQINGILNGLIVFAGHAFTHTFISILASTEGGIQDQEKDRIVFVGLLNHLRDVFERNMKLARNEERH